MAHTTMIASAGKSVRAEPTLPYISELSVCAERGRKHAGKNSNEGADACILHDASRVIVVRTRKWTRSSKSLGRIRGAEVSYPPD